MSIRLTVRLDHICSDQWKATIEEWPEEVVVAPTRELALLQIKVRVQERLGSPPREIETERPELPRDADDQPPPAVNLERRVARSTSELIGFLKGIMLDGELHRTELMSLATWLSANAESDEWPMGLIVSRVHEVLRKSCIEEADLVTLRGLFMKVVGGSRDFSENRPTTLPLTSPPPPITFCGHTFVLTGKFESGPRRRISDQIDALGGICLSRVTRQTDFVVVGALSSRDWLETTHGRKIQAAAEYIAKGAQIRVITEAHLFTYLGRQIGRSMS